MAGVVGMRRGGGEIDVVQGDQKRRVFAMSSAQIIQVDFQDLC